jgi:uncharacterized membrane protein
MKHHERLELNISRFLRSGVMISGILMLTGWIMRTKISGNPFFNFETYDHIPLSDLIAFHLKNKDWGSLLSYLGLIVLMSLPIIRVLLTSILFLKQKEYLLSFISLSVFLGLILSILLGAEL